MAFKFMKKKNEFKDEDIPVPNDRELKKMGEKARRIEQGKNLKKDVTIETHKANVLEEKEVDAFVETKKDEPVIEFKEEKKPEPKKKKQTKEQKHYMNIWERRARVLKEIVDNITKEHYGRVNPLNLHSILISKYPERALNINERKRYISKLSEKGWEIMTGLDPLEITKVFKKKEVEV